MLLRMLLCMLEAVKGGLCLLCRFTRGGTLSANLCTESCGRWALFVEVLDVLLVPEAIHCVLGAVEGGFGLLKVLKVMRCMLLCLLEAVDDGLQLLEMLGAPEVMCCVLLCMLETVEDGLNFEVSKFLLWEILPYIRC